MAARTDASPSPGNAAGEVDRRWLILIPVASLMYLVAYIDRTNISFLLPAMGRDLGLSGADKGLVSGIFFVGYLVLQVPAAILAQRWSAKKTIFWLMLLWGAAAVASGFVQNRDQLFIARFVLGVFEGGVQPAALVLLAAWFSQRQRARANGLWLACLPLSALIAAPVTGMLLTHVDWRAVLIIEGLPPFVCAIAWVFLVFDKPSGAWWMPAGAARRVADELSDDEAGPKGVVSVRYRDVVRNGRVWGLIAFWFLYNSAFYGFTLWLPTVVESLSHGSPERVGWLTAIPYLLALIGMIIIAAIADKLGSRRWAIAVPVLISAAGLLAGQFAGSPALQFIILCIVAATLYIHGPFLAAPAVLLRVEVLALGFGLINGIGNIGGFIGPYAFGWLLDATGSTKIGFLGIAGALVLASIVLLIVVPKTRVGALPTSVEPAEVPRGATG